MGYKQDSDDKVRFLLLMIGWLYAATAWAASPGGTDLLTACSHALKNNFADVEGAMCTYYVTPCDCAAVREAGVPRVCLPDDVPVETLAHKVVDGLVASPDLQLRTAAAAAGEILSVDYPCHGN
jgi:hypothetical protein